MGKNLESVLPNFVEAAPVTVTICGYDDVPQENQAVCGEPLAPSPQERTGGDDHRVSLDEVEQCYRTSDMDSYLQIDISDDADLIDTEEFGLTFIPSGNAKKHKKKGEKKKNSKHELLWQISRERDEDEEEVSPPSASGFPAIQIARGPIKEHELYRILTKKYVFGRYGSSLFVRSADGVYSEVNTQTIEKLLMSTLTEEQLEGFSIGTSRAVRSRLLASPEVNRNQLVFPKEKVLLKNGCFNIVTKKPAEIKDSDFFLTRIDAQYLPGQKLPCPHFDAYLETSSGGDESIKQRFCAMLGYLFLCGYPGKKILVLGTAKNSGKSMISRFYQRLVGPELVCGQTPFDMSESHAMSEFSGKIANMALDVAAAIIKPVSIGVMKALSGGDLISVNPKGRDRRSMICFTKQVIGTNAPLRLQQFDEAFWERVEIIPYLYSIAPDDRNDNLEQDLYEERDAIVTKCLKAAKRLIKNGYRFPECPAADAMKDSWIGWQSYAKVFLQTRCVAEEGCFTPSTPLYQAYLQYCQENALPYGTMTGFITFAKKLFPSNGNSHPMIDGVQRRGLPDVRFLEMP